MWDIKLKSICTVKKPTKNEDATYGMGENICKSFS